MHAGFQAPAPGLYSTAARGKVWSVLKKLKVAVLFGGASSEHEVSRMSATSVLNNLDTEKYDVLPVGITKDGRWYLYSGPVEDLCSGAWERHSGNVPAAICPGSGLAGLVAFENGVCRSLPVDVVFPVLHGKNGEDGTIQGLLELAGLPYVGCGVLGSAVCMDKIIANRVMDATGIPRCEWDCMERWQRPELAAIARRAAEKLGWPIFVKPANAGSSVGISKARDMAELEAAVDLALQHDSRVVFERFVQGQEVECAVRGNDEVSGTHPGEILASAEFYTYDDKYISGTSRVAIPAQLAPEKLDEVRDLAVRAYRALCCKGLARVDFFVEHGTQRVLLNEINTLPGFTSISMYPKLMEHDGVGFSDLVLQVDFDLLEVLTQWNKMPTVEPYRKLDISRYISLISKMREMGFVLTRDQELRASNIPFDETEDALRELFFSFLHRWQRGQAIEQPALPEEEPTLPELEQYYRKLDLYFSFSKAFGCPVDEDKLYSTRERVADEINEILLHRLRNNIRFCARCGKALPLHHRGRLCDACYRRDHRHGPRNSGWHNI